MRAAKTSATAANSEFALHRTGTVLSVDDDWVIALRNKTDGDMEFSRNVLHSICVSVGVGTALCDNGDKQRMGDDLSAASPEEDSSCDPRLVGQIRESIL